jgi:DNA-binding NarL/FixJ family response regulator
VEIVLTDIQMPGMGGIELIMELRRLYPEVKVLMLTMLEDTETVKAALTAGAAGYVFKSASLEVFSRALNTVAAGGTFYSEEVMQRMVESKEGGLDGLTDREVEIIRLITSGLTSVEIAKQLFISVNTVDTHRKNIFSKTGVKNAVGLTHYARKHGIV